MPVGKTLTIMRSAHIIMGLAGLCLPHTAFALAQDPLDRTDAGIIEDEVRQPPMDLQDSVRLPDRSHAPAVTADVEGGVFVGAIRVENSDIPANRFIPVIQNYVGRTLSPLELEELSTAIADVLREDGYIFASAWIAPQRLDTGMLRITVDAGSIADIRYIGAADHAVRRILAPLTQSGPVTESQLERRLLLASDLPGVRITGTQFSRQAGRGVLQVTVEQDPIAAWARLSNEGSNVVGPWRIHGGVDFNGALTDGDRVRVAVSATPIEPGEFSLVRLDYDIPVGDNGTVVGLEGYYARSNPENTAQINDREGESVGAAVTLSHPLLRTRSASLWANAALRYRKTMQDAAGVLIREDRVTTAEITLNGYARLGKAVFSGGGRVTQGLGLFNPSREGDAMTSRFDGSGRFTKFELYGRLWTPLGSNFSIELTGRGQLATRPLLAGDEMGIGGPYYGRGYDYYERAGENGIAGAFELRYDINNVSDGVDNIQLYGFIDGAGVRNRGNGVGGGRLASAGGGARFRILDRFNLDVEAAAPLTGERFDSGDRSPRLRFVLGTRF